MTSIGGSEALRGFLIRGMRPADIDTAVALARAQGWRDRRHFYEFVFRTPTCEPVVGLVDGRVVATGLATTSGRVGWLGAIAVEAEYRRRGIGRAITEDLCRRLWAAGCDTLSLEATEAGRGLYEQMGFRLTTWYHQLQADHLPEVPAAPPGARARPLEASDMPAVLALDRLATAENRSAPLTVMAESGG